MLLFDGITLPLEDPILKFLLILVIILAAPLLLNKLKIPYLLGLIIAGAVIGPHGLNLVLRDSSIILSGTAGLLYIMFLSGLDMDMSDFRKNGTRSLVFGLYTFCVPLLLGILAGYYILGFSIYSSILLAGLFASQTLIAYPIVSKLGIARDKAVTIAVGGTVITDTLARLSDRVIITSDNPRFEEPQDIINDMLAGLDKDDLQKTISIADRKEAIKTACMLAQPGDVILVAGKGHENYQEIKGVKHHFDDKEELKAIMF